MTRTWTWALAWAAVACGGAAARDEARAVLVVRAEVRTAAVWIDDEMIGEVGEISGGIKLRAGTHRVEVRHDDYHTRFIEISLAAGERRVLAVKLAEALP